MCEWTSRWWLALCPTPRSASSCGRTTGGDREQVEQLEGAQRVGPGEHPAQLGESPLPRRLGGPRRRGARQLHGLGVRLEPEGGADPRGAHQPQRVVG